MTQGHLSPPPAHGMCITFLIIACGIACGGVLLAVICVHILDLLTR